MDRFRVIGYILIGTVGTQRPAVIHPEAWAMKGMVASVLLGATTYPAYPTLGRIDQWQQILHTEDIVIEEVVHQFRERPFREVTDYDPLSHASHQPCL